LADGTSVFAVTVLALTDVVGAVEVPGSAAADGRRDFFVVDGCVDTDSPDVFAAGLVFGVTVCDPALPPVPDPDGVVDG